MTPKKLAAADADAAKKRKRDKAEDRDDRKARKKQKSKSKTSTQTNADEVDQVQPHSPTGGKVVVPALQDASSDGAKAVQKRDTRGKGPSTSWKVSKPSGGRMLDLDPVFSDDEEHLIIAYNTSIQVYSTADSLLVRRIQLLTGDIEEAEKSPGVYIVSTALSKVSPNLVWVASSDGRIWCIDWTSGAGADTPFTIPAKKILDMTVDQAQIGKALDDVVLVLEKTSHSGGQIIAYDRKSLASQSGKTLHTCDDSPQLLRSVDSSSVLVVATKNSLHIGVLKGKNKELKSLGNLEYQFFSFDVEDQITALDIRLPAQPKKNSNRITVDFAVGCARGAILTLPDVLAKFYTGGGVGSTPRKGSLQPRTLHWHSRAVNSVKWSQNGDYLISGGSEGVLVLWQLDTGKKDFLPHLSASIENIVVSPNGSSYAVHLDDNSAMVLSTAEMTPTTYVSGIQSLTFNTKRSKDSLVRRVWHEPDFLCATIPATSSPTHPNLILIPTGNGQKSTAAECHVLSAPYLQVFDLESCQSVAKQAVARANPTDSRLTAQGYPIIEPTITQVSFSHNGKWLATVDEWYPPERDVEPLVDGANTIDEVCSARREIYLKFWEVGQNGSSFQLASRVNEAHYTTKPEAVFDLASDPASTRFATVGGDGVVRIWSPKLRQKSGLSSTASEGEYMWRWCCTREVELERAIDQEDDLVGFRGQNNVSGALDFSDDGSTLFVAYGEPSEAVVYIIDAESGQVRDRLFGMINGAVKALKAVGSCLVILSGDLRVYNVVSDELHYGVSLMKIFGGAVPPSQFAVNRKSRSFALSTPISATQEEAPKKGTASELVIFSVDDNQPHLVRTIPHLITSLIPARSSSGFIAVDTAAQIWSVGIESERSVLAQPLADIHLDKEDLAANKQIALVTDGEEDAASDDEMQDADAGEEPEEDYDIHQAVIAPQRLAEIFNSGPAFAMPPIENVFYQVAELLASKPVAPSAA